MVDGCSGTWWTGGNPADSFGKRVVAELGFERGAEVERAQPFPGEVDVEATIAGGWPQGHGQSRESLSDGEEVVFEGDLAFGFNGANVILGQVFDGGQTRWQGT